MPRLLIRLRLALLAAAAFVAPVAADPPAPRGPAAVFIRLDADGKPVVTAVDFDSLGQPSPAPGLLVWADADSRERWRVIPKGWTLPAGETPAPDPAVALAATRSAGGTTGAAADTTAFTAQLDPLRGSVVTRDVDGFLTPVDLGPGPAFKGEVKESVLTNRPTIRRLPNKKGAPYPAAVALLTANLPGEGGKDREVIVRIPFKAGQTAVRFDEIPGLPGELRGGLARGKRHSLRAEKGIAATTFRVEEQARAARVLRPLEEMARVLGGRSDPLYQQFALQHLLAQTDGEGVPLYLADALDELERVPEKSLSPSLRRQRERVIGWLKAPRQDRKEALAGPAAPGDKTGIEEIDEARELIASGQWKEALEVLDRKAFLKRQEADKRTRGLAQLYRGVVRAEAGQGGEAQAARAFGQAVELLAGGAPQDLFRAHNNYADFLQQRAQDQLYNHALQMAAGVERPFLTALEHWLAARRHYEAALPLAEKLKRPADAAAVRVNLARLHALLADLVRTLAPRGGFADGERAATRVADEYAARAAETAEPLVRAQATEIRAHLAYRAKDLPACRKFASETLRAFLEQGYLSGVENAECLLGLTAASPAEALKHLQVAHLITESLRERLPPDKVGLTQAGFFARRAWVVERIVELLLEQGKDGEALRYAELARARALQDLLLTDQGRAAAGEDTAADFLARWPKDVAAVEYFLGPERAWVFVVSTAGQVKAHPLKDADGSPVRTRELVARVQRFLHEVEGQSTKMYNRVLAGKGFDHAWQGDLHRLYRELLPAAAMAELRRAKIAVVVPQHILHYFPFAALVTAPDKDPGPKAMAKPRFLLDEPFTLCYAPSLTTWARLRDRPAAPVTAVNAVGLVQAPGADPLPGVEVDLKNLRAVFGARVRTVQEDERATTANAARLLGERGLLFFATHGLNEADRPLDSYLILLPDESAKPDPAAGANDGRLTARAIFNRKVHADLLVMSACYSGLGDRSPLPGDDLFGLQRAFLQSGARTVVSGLWDVYDGTAPELMKGFFQRLAGGAPACVALAGSQRAFLERLRASRGVEPWLHPYFWSVYTAAGDHRTAFGK
jgi:CHAT domain-containing protein